MGPIFDQLAQDEVSLFAELELENALKAQAGPKRQPQQQQHGNKSSVNFPVTRSQPGTIGRQQDYERLHPGKRAPS